jgi:glucose/arabinose dehydrogenase
MTLRRTALAGLTLAALTLPAAGDPWPTGPKNADFAPAFPEQTRAPARASGVTPEVERFAGPLEEPWGIDALPGGGYLVTEQPGRLRHVAGDGTISAPISGVPEVLYQRQGGLLDVTAAPDFAQSRRIYLTYAKPLGGGLSATAAATGVLSDDMTALREVEDIFVQTPGSPNPMHYGSRLVFDGDGHLFITTGEHSSRAERVLAQDLGTTYGKVVRLAADGGVPADNPFTGRADAIDSIWSYGHRNVQGAAIEPGTGRLWTIEHGPAGGDELNAPEPGVNYGWPVISYGVNYGGSAVGAGEAVREGMAQPRYYWDPVIAPSDMIFYDGGMFADWQGDLLIGSLNPGGLVRLELDGDTVTGEERFLEGEYRIRDVEIAPDGAILLLWDSPDGAVLRLTPGG